MSTIHNPTNFDPTDYTVEDYLDTKRPDYCGGPVEAYRAIVETWEADMVRALGQDWRAKSSRCVHCGHTGLRWIAVVRHTPTDEAVVFGSACVRRLGFADKATFTLARIQRLADGRAAALKVWNEVQTFLAAHPEIVAAQAAIEEPAHAGNEFVRDVLAKLTRYGSLSDRQVAAVAESLARDIERARRKAEEAEEVKGDAPDGRVEVTGTVLSVQTRATDFGDTTKALVKLANNAKVWITANDDRIVRGASITVRATFRRADNDRSFAFGSRPHVVAVA